MSWIDKLYSYFENQDTLRTKEGAAVDYAWTYVLIRTLPDKTEIIIILHTKDLDKRTP